MDSDFDYLFDGHTEQSRLVNESPYLFHTYEPTQRKITCAILLRYTVSVRKRPSHTLIFSLKLSSRESNFANHRAPAVFVVRLFGTAQESNGFLAHRLPYQREGHDSGFRDNGNPRWNGSSGRPTNGCTHWKYTTGTGATPVGHFWRQIAEYGVTPYNVYYFMQGDSTPSGNVIITLLHAVCDKLRDITTQRINMGTKQGVALKNEISNYNNALRNRTRRHRSTTSITRTASFTTNCKTISSATSPR